MEEGFLRLSRRFFSNELWKAAREFSECEAWLDLIQSARFEATDKAYSELIGGREISYSRGQYPATVSFLKKRWGWKTEKRVRCFLDRLKKKGMITTDSSQGMNIITLCKYDEYNPLPKDEGQRLGQASGQAEGKDAYVKISDLREFGSMLGAELRASIGQIVEETMKNYPKQGQTKGNKKKKKESNNIYPPTPPEGEGINKKARLAFEEHYRQVFGNDYYWTAKDAGAMSKLLQKLRFQREQKQLDVSDDSIIYALCYLLSSINEGWIFENFSVTNINSKFNEIVSQIKTAHNGNSRSSYSSKQEANAYALSLLQQHKRELEEGMADKMERPF